LKYIAKYLTVKQLITSERLCFARRLVVCGISADDAVFAGVTSTAAACVDGRTCRNREVKDG